MVRFNQESGAAVAFKALKGGENGEEKVKEEAGEDEKSQEKENQVKDDGDTKVDSLVIDFLNQSVTVSLVSGEEEIQFWREFKNKQKNQNYKRKPWQSKSLISCSRCQTQLILFSLFIRQKKTPQRRWRKLDQEAEDRSLRFISHIFRNII